MSPCPEPPAPHTKTVLVVHAGIPPTNVLRIDTASVAALVHRVRLVSSEQGGPVGVLAYQTVQGVVFPVPRYPRIPVIPHVPREEKALARLLGTVRETPRDQLAETHALDGPAAGSPLRLAHHGTTGMDANGPRRRLLATAAHVMNGMSSSKSKSGAGGPPPERAGG